MHRPYLLLVIVLFFALVRTFSSADPPAATQPAGVRGLEFHILAYDQTDPALAAMNDRMKPGGQGPSPQAGDTKYRWFEVAHPELFDRPGFPARTVAWNDKNYLLALITPEASMDDSQPWAVARAFPTFNSSREMLVAVQYAGRPGWISAGGGATPD